MDIYKYINHLVQKAEKPSVPTGMTKEHHIDIIGQALQGYDPKTVLAIPKLFLRVFPPTVKESYVMIHRLCRVLHVLLE